MRLKQKTKEIFKRCYENSRWLYNDTVFLSKKYNWEKFKQYAKEREVSQ